MIADSYAQEYNRRGSAQKVGFLPVSVVRLERPFRGATFVCMEPLMSGRYVKHSDNAGHIGTSADVPQAFSHFSYEVGRRLKLSRYASLPYHFQSAAGCLCPSTIHL